MFGTIVESYHAASTQLMEKIRSALPEGATACRIRATARESHRPTTGTLLETLGEESQGMVFLDPSGMPLKYDQLQVYRRGWIRTASRSDSHFLLPGGARWVYSHISSEVFS